MKDKKVTEITIIIPSLNPDDKFIKTLDGILEKGFQKLVVVDDGSDGEHKEPFQYAKEKGCTVLVHEVNKGKGRALKTAFEYCLSCKDCIGVITVDGDGQHTPEDIYHCGQEMLARNNQNVILGCRDFAAENVPFKSKYGNNITRFAFRFLCGIKISDTQTGLRAIPAEYLEAMLGYKGERFEYETNMLLEMKSQGIPFSEVKIETVYLDDNASTHFHPWKDSLRIYKIIFKYGLSAGASSVIDLLLFYLALSVLELLHLDISLTTEVTVLAATVFARIISSLFNYSVNRKVVFQAAQSKNSLGRYYMLCVVQMLASAGLVACFSSVLAVEKFGKLMVKLVVDTGLFFVSFVIQREWVFEKKKFSERTGRNR